MDTYVCVHSPGSINGYECVAEEVLLLQQCGRVIIDVYCGIWKFNTLNFYVASVGE